MTNILKKYLEESEQYIEPEQLNEAFMDFFKKKPNEAKVKIFKATHKELEALKGEVYAIENSSPIIDALITMLGIPDDGTPIKIRTGFMAYDSEYKLLVFSRYKYDLPGLVGKRPTK